MNKIVTAIAVTGVAFLLALPAPATAKTRTDGASNIEHTEFSAQRRHSRSHRHWRGHRHAHRGWQHRHRGWRGGRYWAPRYAWGPRYRYRGPRYGYYRPLRYGYRPYYRPYAYYGPRVSVGFWGGPRFGFWF